MDDVLARIKENVIVLYPDILEDLSITDAFLDLIISDVVNRALIYTNRIQLLDGYTHFLDDDFNSSNTFYDMNGDPQPILPVPTQLEIPLSRAVVGACRTAKGANTGMSSIKSLSDNGQSVTYGEYISSFLATTNDTELFSGSTSLLDKFRLATIVGNTY